MGTRIERDFSFHAGVYFEGNFIMNTYDLILSMEVETDSISEQNIAMDRIEYFLTDCLANSIFVEQGEKKVIENYQLANLKVCNLPEEPYDQIVGLLLMLKLNAITEGRLIITDMVLESELSNGVRFNYDIESAVQNPFSKKGWWHESTQTITDIKASKREKIVRLVKHCDWCEPGLEWEEKSSNSAEIIFTPETEK